MIRLCIDWAAKIRDKAADICCGWVLTPQAPEVGESYNVDGEPMGRHRPRLGGADQPQPGRRRDGT